METCTLEASNINKKRVDGLTLRVCLPLESSDPGRLLSLLRSLFENTSDILQIKINKYLAEVTKSIAAFIIINFHRKGEYKITVMGESPLDLHIHIPEDSRIIQRLVERSSEAERYVEIGMDDVEEETKKAVVECVAEVEKRTGKPLVLVGLLAVGVRHPISEETLLHVVLINPAKEPGYRRTCAALVDETMRYCLGTLVNAFSYEEEKRDHERARDFIEIMKETLMNIESTEGMVWELRGRVCDLLEAERSSLFLRDECGHFVRCGPIGLPDQPHAFDPSEVARLPGDFGLLGIVAETGGVVNCRDARNDPRYCIDLDRQAGLETRNVLCFALRQGEEVVGAVEVYNKAETREGRGFNIADEVTASALSVLLAPLLLHSLAFTKLQEQNSRTSLTDALYLSRDPVPDEDVEDVVKCELVHDYRATLDLGFSHLELPDWHTGCLVYDLLDGLGLVSRFRIDPRTLVRFILSIMRDQPSFPFHNWRQTLGTFHFAVVLISQLDLVSQANFTHVEVLALVVAALTHSAGYGGAQSVFQVSSGTTLGALYSTPAHISQKFQSSQVFRLLHNADTNILENIPSEQFRVFAHLLKKLFSAADMGYYLMKLPSIEESLRIPLIKDDLEQRLHLLCLLMASSVLSDYSKDFPHCRRIAELSYSEFLPNVERGAAEGVFNLSAFNHSVELIPLLQIQIIESLGLPTFRIMSQVFPVTYPCYERCQTNLETWVRYKDKFEEIWEAERAAELVHQAEAELEAEQE